MKTTAQEIVDGACDANHCIDMCEHDVNLKETEQDWDKETTTYHFKDGSKVIVNNRYYEAK